jgi:hypothetical protein
MREKERERERERESDEKSEIPKTKKKKEVASLSLSLLRFKKAARPLFAPLLCSPAPSFIHKMASGFGLTGSAGR